MQLKTLLLFTIVLTLVCSSLSPAGPSIHFQVACNNLQGTSVELTPTEAKLYENCFTEKRSYNLPGQKLTVLVVDAGNNPHAVHSPDFCLRSAGWNVEEGDFALPGGVGSRVTAHIGHETEQVLYWFSEGSEQFQSFPEFRWKAGLSRLSGDSPVFVVLACRGEVKWTKVLNSYPDLARL